MIIPPTLSLVLASKSPRRSYLLEQAGIPFTVRTADVKEVYPDDLPAPEVGPYLARLKAAGAMHLLKSPHEVLLTADSVVMVDGKVFGKPRDRNHALETLRQIVGRRHTVVTGCCLKNGEKERVFAGRSDVYMREATDRELEWYVDRYRPYDKAGSYGIQEWIGLAKIYRIDGTYPNVMGLPVDLVYEELVKW